MPQCWRGLREFVKRLIFSTKRVNRSQVYLYKITNKYIILFLDNKYDALALARAIMLVTYENQGLYLANGYRVSILQGSNSPSAWSQIWQVCLMWEGRDNWPFFSVVPWLNLCGTGIDQWSRNPQSFAQSLKLFLPYLAWVDVQFGFSFVSLSSLIGVLSYPKQILYWKYFSKTTSWLCF
jgi:hypothetical protein